MDSSGPPIWPNPKKKFLPKRFLVFSPKTNFPNEKDFDARLKEPITCLTHLIHPKKRNLHPKVFLYLPERKTSFHA